MDIAQQQDANPYAPPRVNTDTEGPSTKRYPWVAVLLAMLSPVYALLYAGRASRALVYFAAVPVMYLIVLGTTAYLGIPVNAASAICGIGFVLIGAADGYRCARAWRAGAALPWYAQARCLLPIMVVGVLCMISLRAFLVEPFHIPVNSMQPTLVAGDYIAVSKSAYGLRFPESDGRFAGSGAPARGDVAVFRYPENPSIHYIKRVIGMPGDRIDYHDKRLTINGQPVARTALPEKSDPGVQRFRETLGRHTYAVEIHTEQPAVQLASVRQFESRERCEYDDNGFRCDVPAGRYFVMGDNRDSSSDSRYWGFVPEAYLAGRAVFVWSSQNHPERIGLRIE